MNGHAEEAVTWATGRLGPWGGPLRKAKAQQDKRWRRKDRQVVVHITLVAARDFLLDRHSFISFLSGTWLVVPIGSNKTMVSVDLRL